MKNFYEDNSFSIGKTPLVRLRWVNLLESLLIPMLD
jgi:hypothetical protein